MKKNILLVISFIVITLVIVSCKKDTVTQADNYDNEMVTQSKRIVSLIKNFDEKMNSTLKSGEMIPLDSVVWNTEALENYTYAYPDSSAKDYQFFRSNYTLTVDANNMVLVDDVQALYNQMTTDYLANLNEIPSDIKHLVFTDVALDSIVGTTAYLTAARGFGFNWVLNTYWGFNADDDWYWGTISQEYGQPPLGKCDGTEVGVSDGSDELQWRLNNPLVLPSGDYTYINLETKETDGFYFEGENGPRLYAGWDYDEDNCLTNDTLTYFLLQSHYIINNYNEGFRPTDKAFVSVQIRDALKMSNFGGQYYHLYEVTYGTLVPIGLPD